jgi:hypothetical protein
MISGEPLGSGYALHSENVKPLLSRMISGFLENSESTAEAGTKLPGDNGGDGDTIPSGLSTVTMDGLATVSGSEFTGMNPVTNGGHSEVDISGRVEHHTIKRFGIPFTVSSDENSPGKAVFIADSGNGEISAQNIKIFGKTGMVDIDSNLLSTHTNTQGVMTQPPVILRTDSGDITFVFGTNVSLPRDDSAGKMIFDLINSGAHIEIVMEIGGSNAKSVTAPAEQLDASNHRAAAPLNPDIFTGTDTILSDLIHDTYYDNLNPTFQRSRIQPITVLFSEDNASPPENNSNAIEANPLQSEISVQENSDSSSVFSTNTQTGNVRLSGGLETVSIPTGDYTPLYHGPHPPEAEINQPQLVKIGHAEHGPFPESTSDSFTKTGMITGITQEFDQTAAPESGPFPGSTSDSSTKTGTITGITQEFDQTAAPEPDGGNHDGGLFSRIIIGDPEQVTGGTHSRNSSAGPVIFPEDIISSDREHPDNTSGAQPNHSESKTVSENHEIIIIRAGRKLFSTASIERGSRVTGSETGVGTEDITYPDGVLSQVNASDAKGNEPHVTEVGGENIAVSVGKAPAGTILNNPKHAGERSQPVSVESPRNHILEENPGTSTAVIDETIDTAMSTRSSETFTRNDLNQNSFQHGAPDTGRAGNSSNVLRSSESFRSDPGSDIRENSFTETDETIMEQLCPESYDREAVPDQSGADDFPIQSHESSIISGTKTARIIAGKGFKEDHIQQGSLQAHDVQNRGTAAANQGSGSPETLQAGTNNLGAVLSGNRLENIRVPENNSVPLPGTAGHHESQSDSGKAFSGTRFDETVTTVSKTSGSGFPSSGSSSWGTNTGSAGDQTRHSSPYFTPQTVSNEFEKAIPVTKGKSAHTDEVISGISFQPDMQSEAVSGTVHGSNIFTVSYGNTISPETELKVMNTIVQSARFMINSGHSSAEIRLEPPNLGKLRLEIATENSRVTGKITVESHEVKDIIQNNLASLKDQLTQNGLKVESFDVQVGHNNGTDSWANREYMENLNLNLRRDGYNSAPVYDTEPPVGERILRGKSLNSEYLDLWI